MKITICGLAASGKGTTGRRAAAKLGLVHLDVGLIYRAIYFTSVIRGLNSVNDHIDYVWDGNKGRVLIDNNDETVSLIGSEVGNAVAEFSERYINVLENFANEIISRYSQIIVDGRNAGSSLLPCAQYKFCTVAPLLIRASRRYKDLRSIHENISYLQVLKDLATRDNKDKYRKINPFRIPSDATILDTSQLPIDEAVNIICSFATRGEK